MTSAKYFSRWFREAGRSHLVSVLSWGFLSLYMVMTLVDISADSEYVFFGLGSMELCVLCTVLGLAFSGLEFFYLFQVRQQDFYYSLPVKKSTVFFSRYIHGLCQFFTPLLVTQMLLAVYEAVNIRNFTPYAGAYLARSVGAALLVFLIFYHTGILAVVISGKIITAVAALVLFLLYFQVMIQNIFYGYVKEFYLHFYRIPLFDEAGKLLAPFALAKSLMGTGIYDCKEVWEYEPKGSAVLAAFLWAGVFLTLALLVHKERKTEKTGRAFVSAWAERVVEGAVSLLAGMGFGILLLDMTQVKEYGIAAEVLVIGVCGIVGACGGHLLIECLVRTQGSGLWQRKWQMCVVSACAFAAGCLFLVNKTGFDDYIPKREQVAEMAFCVNGIDMSQRQFGRAKTEDNSVTEERLLWYSMAEEESIDEGLTWVQGALNGGDSKVTTATVCYRLKDGSRRYRRYPLNQKALDSFANVYETKEYKKRAYPLIEIKDVKKGQITWSDGIDERMLGMSEGEKEALLAAYKEDVAGLKMDDLKTDFPVGCMEIISEVDGIYQEAMIYPFFEKTLKVLEGAGVDTDKSLADYKIASMKVQTSTPMSKGYSGGVNVHFYDKENDIAQWSKKLIPDNLAIQPLLCPVKLYVEAEVQVEDEAVGGIVVVDCYEMEGGVE